MEPFTSLARLHSSGVTLIGKVQCFFLICYCKKLCIRWSYENSDSPVPPPYTIYTGLDLGKAFLVFWIIFFLHVSAILITKLLTARHMRESNILDMILHAVQNSNIPFPYKDWDVDNGTIEEHRARFGATLTEVNCVMAVNFFFNSLLLGPLIYTGQRYQ